MNETIDVAADCEIRGVIRFLNHLNVKPVEIHRQLVAVYGENVMNERNVRKWCERFRNTKRVNVHDEERSGRPSIINEDLLKKVDEEIKNNRRVTISELTRIFPGVSRAVIGRIVHDHLGFRKVCARWVPYALSERHKQIRMGSALEFLMRYKENGDEFLNSIVTGDETWISYYTPERKRQSCEWRHPQSPTKPKKIKPLPFGRKLMATVFWDRFGILLIDFTPRGTTVNAEYYCETLLKLRVPFRIDAADGLPTASYCCTIMLVHMWL